MKKLKRSLVQTTIDAGQKEIGTKYCSLCGMLYSIGDPDDMKAHAKFHEAKFRKKPIHINSRLSNSLYKVSSDLEGNSVVILNLLNGVERKLFESVVSAMDAELGRDSATSSTASKSNAGDDVTTAAQSNDQSNGRANPKLFSKTFLYLCRNSAPSSRKYKTPKKIGATKSASSSSSSSSSSSNWSSSCSISVIGCCILEEISRAYRLNSNHSNNNNTKEETDHTADDDATGNKIAGGEGGEEGGESEAIVAVGSEPNEKAVCGVRRIWVAAEWRRSGIASKLLSAACAHFYFGCGVPREQLAFSSPTPLGRRFAQTFCRRPDFLIYL